MDFIRKYLRRRFLRKNASTVETSLLPLDRISSALVVLDVEEQSFHECKDAVDAWFKQLGIKHEIIYFDFRHIGKDEFLITTLDRTILRKEIHWTGIPSVEKVRRFSAIGTDLLLSLVGNSSYPIECISKCSKAKFKIGRRQLPGSTFDLVVTDSEDRSYTAIEAFGRIKEVLAKIS